MYYLYHIVYIETIVFFIVVECSFFLESNWGPFCTEVENIDRSIQHFIFKDNQNLSVETLWSQGIEILEAAKQTFWKWCLSKLKNLIRSWQKVSDKWQRKKITTFPKYFLQKTLLLNNFLGRIFPKMTDFPAMPDCLAARAEICNNVLPDDDRVGSEVCCQNSSWRDW